MCGQDGKSVAEEGKQARAGNAGTVGIGVGMNNILVKWTIQVK